MRQSLLFALFVCTAFTGCSQRLSKALHSQSTEAVQSPGALDGTHAAFQAGQATYAFGPMPFTRVFDSNGNLVRYDPRADYKTLWENPATWTEVGQRTDEIELY